MSLQPWETSHKHLPEVALELFPHKGVEDGAEAEVNVGQVTSEFLGVIPRLQRLAAMILWRHQQQQQPNNVIRRPADEEQQDDNEYQPDRLELGHDPGRYDCNADPHVAVDDDNQREDQEEEELNVESSTSQPLRVDVVQFIWILATVDFIF